MNYIGWISNGNISIRDPLSTISLYLLSLTITLKIAVRNVFQEALRSNRPFRYSEKEPQSNDSLQHFVEFSNVHNSDRSSNATRSNFGYKNV